MINVMVTYTIEKDFVAENKANIAKFLEAFQQLDNNKFSYTVFVKEDGVTFVHIANYADEDIQKQLLAVPAFVEFQQKRDASSQNINHSFSVLNLIASSQPVL